jgi:hypothetical protein
VTQINVARRAIAYPSEAGGFQAHRRETEVDAQRGSGRHHAYVPDRAAPMPAPKGRVAAMIAC